MPDKIFNQLIESLERWPGIGPRQAKRLAYWLASQPHSQLVNLNRLIADLPKLTSHCQDCQRLFWSEIKSPQCQWCQKISQQEPELMIVEKDIDLANIQKMSNYRGGFFVLGGLLPLNGDDHRLRLSALKKLILQRISQAKLTEIILALSVSPEGDHTADYLVEKLRPILAENNIIISSLGRGLSAGTDLEYSDPDTLKNAWQNRQAKNKKLP